VCRALRNSTGKRISIEMLHAMFNSMPDDMAMTLDCTEIAAALIT
jgi:hypothetical protein